VGYTPYYAVGVWVGRADNEPLAGLTGVSAAAPIWHDVMEAIHKNLPVLEFQKPQNVISKLVCGDKDCEKLSRELYLDSSPNEPEYKDVLVVSPRPHETFSIDKNYPSGHQKVPFEVKFLKEEAFADLEWFLDNKKIGPTKGNKNIIFEEVPVGEHKAVARLKGKMLEEIPFRVE
jgi:penicillin-binding protein 1C